MHPINHLYLFGSYTRDEQTENRDIDILVDLSKPVGLQFVHLQWNWSHYWIKKADIITVNGIEEKKMRYIKEDLIDVKNVFVKDFEKSSKKGVKIWKRQESLKQSNQMYYMNWINT